MKLITILLGTILFFSLLHAQDLLNNPEHVVYDTIHQCYLATNYGNGKVISIDNSGEQNAVIEGLAGCLGIHIVDEVIYVTAGQYLYLYDLETYEYIDTITPAVTSWIDGMIDDGDGSLYAVENSGRVHKIDLSDHTCTVIVNSGLPYHPQDLAYDPIENRLLLVAWGSNSAITAIDLLDYTVTPLIPTSSGQYDGIVRDEDGNLYVSSWLNGGRIYKWEFPYTTEPIILSQGHAGPAGLGLNQNENILAVPNFNGNTISYINTFISGTDDLQISSEIELDIYPNPFNPSGSGRSSIITISFFTPLLQGYDGQAVDTKVVIYNLKGQRIKTLDYSNSSVTLSGNERTYSITWHCTDDADNPVSSGIYIARLTSGDQAASRKMMLIR